VVGLEPAASVTVGGAFSCARTAAGAIWCWGDNHWGQLGSQGPSTATPRLATAVGPAVSFAADLEATCALGSTGAIHCAGFSGFGLPVDIEPTESPAVAIAAGSRLCALLASTRVQCWGSFGNPGPSDIGLLDGVLLGVTGIDEVATDLSHVCVLLHDGRVACNANTFLYNE
jgi:hypothetical protein